MPPIALVIGAAVAIATIGTAILHISSSESNSSSITDIPEKSNDTLKDKVELLLLKKLLNGIVTIESKISSSEANEKQERQERIESIASTLEGKITSEVINMAQDIVEKLNDSNIFDSVAETIASEVNDVTNMSDSSPVSDGGAIPNPLNPPSIPYEDTTSPPLIPPSMPDEGEIVNPLTAPDIGDTSSPPSVPPDDGPSNPPPLIPPAVASKELEDYINWAKKKTGTGEYSEVGGHHIHAKAAFKGDVNYSPDKGFSISQDYMESKGWDHAKMTKKQRELFKELHKSGRPNTLEEHTRIAEEALIAGGATEAEAKELIEKSLKNLQEQGVKNPTRIPWYSK